MTQLYSIHGDAGDRLDYRGYSVLTEGIGHHAEHVGGKDYRHILARGRVPIVRLNNGYHPYGTIPPPAYYPDFAQRCANFVAASRGCSRWIIGNEPNLSIERPQGQPITPADYAECYTLCRDAIKQVQPGAQVLVGAVGPWNVETKYPGNDSGCWLTYFEDIQHEIGVDGLDGFALHTYTREQTPASVRSFDRMEPPFEFAHNGFRTFADWMSAILPRFQGLPTYITEFCVAGRPWQDVNAGCIRAAYEEINHWNVLHPATPIQCMAVYRWGVDEYTFGDLPEVIRDFRTAVTHGYSWPIEELPPPQEETMQNGSFELPYHEHPTLSTIKVADRWLHFASNGNPPLSGGSSGPCQLPEYKPAPRSQDPRRVVEGETAQCWFIRWKVMDGGVMQRIKATPGASYRFNVMAQAWCSDSDDPTVSDGELYVSLGIDPTGSTRAFSPFVEWSQWEWIGADYKRVGSRTVQATEDYITVFVRAANKWALSHNDVYIDDAHLEQTSTPGPGPGPVAPIDYGRIRDIVREELIGRDPVVWPNV